MFKPTDLKIAATATHNNVDYIVLDDGAFLCVYEEESVDFGAEYENYNAFCQATPAIRNEDIIAQVCREAGLRGATAAGSGVWVEAAKDASDDDSDDAGPTVWGYELAELTIADGDGMGLTVGNCLNNHDHLLKVAQDWADRRGESVYIVSDDGALNDEVEPSEAA